MTNQPKWVRAGTVGDISPVDYGGGIVFVDKTGAYAPEVEYYEPRGDDDNALIDVYRFSCDKCTYIDGVLSDNKYHPDHSVWFNVADLQSQFNDDTNLIQSFCGDDPMARASAWCEVGYYWGFDNLDNYPIALSRKDANKRAKGAK